MGDASIYTVGGAVDDGVYIRRRADDELFHHCRRGDYVCILTARQMGKSSVVMRTAQRLQAEAGVRAVFVDLTQFGGGESTTADTWYLSLLLAVQEQLGLPVDVETWWRLQQTTPTHRFTTFLEHEVPRHIDAPVVVFLDEIDTIVRKELGPDFFAALRFLYQERIRRPALKRLTFVLVGTVLPSDLVTDKTRTPFNIGEQIELTDFTTGEAAPLADGFGLPPRDAGKALALALEWTGGHPYLTQRLCRAMARSPRSPWTASDVAKIVRQEFLADDGKHDSNLCFVRDMLLSPVSFQVPDILRLYRKVLSGWPVRDESGSTRAAHLKLAGILLSKTGRLRVRNRIYKHVFDHLWILRHFPVDWQRYFRRQLFVTIIMFLGVISLAYATRRYRAQAEELKKAKDILETNELALNTAKNDAELARRDAERNAKAQEVEAAAAKAARQEETNARREAVERRKEAEHQKRQAEALAQELRSREKESILNAQKEAIRGLREDELRRRLAEIEEDKENSPNIQRRSQIDTLAAVVQFVTDQSKHASILSDAIPLLYVPRKGDMLSREGSLFALGTVARIMDDQPRQDSLRLQRHGSRVTRAIFVGDRLVTHAPDDPSICASSPYGWTQIWCTHGANAPRLLDAIEKDGLLFADDRGQFWQRSWSTSAAARTVGTVSAQAPLRWLRFSASGDRIFLIDKTGAATVWQRTPRSAELTTPIPAPPDDRITTGDFAPDGDWLAVGTRRGAVLLFDLHATRDTMARARPVFTVENASAGPLRSLMFAHSRSQEMPRLAIAGSDQKARVLSFVENAATGKPRLTIAAEAAGHIGAINAAVISSDGRLLATAGNDGQIRLCDVDGIAFRDQSSSDSQDRACATFAFDGGFVTSLAFSPAGDWLVAGGQGGVLRVFPAEPSRYLRLSCQRIQAIGPEQFPKLRSYCAR